MEKFRAGKIPSGQQVLHPVASLAEIRRRNGGGPGSGVHSARPENTAELHGIQVNPARTGIAE